MAFGAKDARGIFQFGEDDAEATFSQLLNRGMQSVSDATKYFSGTPAQRALLTPAPDGATWIDTDSRGKTWTGIGGVWVDIVFGHAGRVGGIQSGSGVAVLTLQEGLGGITLVNVTPSGKGLKVPVAGLYRITFSILATGGSAYKASGEVRVNGTALKGVSTYKPTTDDLHLDGTVTKTLAADDVVTVFCNQGSYGTTGYNGTFLEVERIG